MVRQTHQVLGQTAERGDQTLHHVVAALLKVERAAQNEQNTRDAVDVVQLDPLLELLTESSRRDTLESDTSRLARLLQLLGRERVNALGVDHLMRSAHSRIPKRPKTSAASHAHHVIHADALKLVPDLVLEEVVRAKGVDVDILAHGHELRTGQVVEGDVIVEELRDPNDIGLGWLLASRTNLGSSARVYNERLLVLTLRKNCLNSSLFTTLSAFRPDSRTVSCKNLAISIRTRSSLRCFSAAARSPSKVLGSMFGKSRRATGRRNSMKGTMTKTENGSRRRRSVVVRLSWPGVSITRLKSCLYGPVVALFE